jgi:HTH-type transcriptional regulator / antitoxin MqsA
MMFHCDMCGSSEFRAEKVSEVFQLAGKPVLVEAIPATVCTQCGETTFSRTTTEQLRKMLNHPKPAGQVTTVDVYAFPA